MIHRRHFTHWVTTTDGRTAYFLCIFLYFDRHTNNNCCWKSECRCTQYSSGARYVFISEFAASKVHYAHKRPTKAYLNSCLCVKSRRGLCPVCVLMCICVCTCTYFPFVWSVHPCHIAFLPFQFPHYTLARNQMDLHEYKMHFSVFFSLIRSPSLSLARTHKQRHKRTHKPPWYPLNKFLNCLSQHCLESVRAVRKPESEKCYLQPWFICYYLLLLST